ncbi:GxxExxY protein [Dysgonomonas sp. 511]|uniref:GxxExxY protein n=1 Tax=Dysgonomonas sp. 511 TaxID=2302930 RepID=UPI0013D43AA4|nr:GxxExxY protein [Dysgonomonas sp. 511]NDV77777.1 GxxExxY protein [Dysgonomonas sp. 511]
MFYEKELTGKILRCAYSVHSELGPGLLEKTYEACLFYELRECGLYVEKQVELPVCYKGVEIDVGYRIDLFVENSVILELKSVEELTDIHTAQLLTYLKLAECKIGYLMNFNVRSLKSGIKRFVL